MSYRLITFVLFAATALGNVASGFTGSWPLQWQPQKPWIRAWLACSRIPFVSRPQWGARYPKNQERLKEQPVRLLFVHHTEGPECHAYRSCSAVMRFWQNFHMDTRGWDDLGYSFLIGGDGRVYTSRGWDRSGAHTRGYNDVSLAVAFIGHYGRHLPPPWALRTFKRLLLCGRALGKIHVNYTLHGHRDANCRECPGDALYSEISRWKHFGGRLKKYICEQATTSTTTSTS